MPSTAHAGALVAGWYLRHLRRQAAMRRAQAAQQAGVSAETIAALELGVAEAAPALLALLLEAYGLTDAAQRSAVVVLAEGRNATRDVVYDIGPGWDQRLAAVQDQGEDFVAGGELTWPAVLWSRDWRHALAGQQRLSRVLPPLPPAHARTVEAVVAESAAYIAYGGDKVLRAQIAHVLELVNSGRVRVRIVPMSAGLAVPPVTQIRTPRARINVADAGWSGVAYSTAPAVLGGYRAQLEEAARYALTAEASASWLAGIAAGDGEQEPTIGLLTSRGGGVL